MERRRTVTPMVYYKDGIPITETLAAQRKIDLLLSFKLKR